MNLVVTVCSGLLTWLGYYLVAGFFGNESPIFIASLAVGVMAAHECGHMIGMRLCKIRSTLRFFVIGAGVKPVPHDELRYHRLPWDRLTFVYLAGVLVNIAIVMSAAILAHFQVISIRTLQQVVNLNGFSIFYNLMPMPFLSSDGSKFLKLLFDSADERTDNHLLWTLALIMYMATGLVIVVAFNTTFLLAVGLTFWGLRKSVKHSDPTAHKNHHALTPFERYGWLTVYIIIFVVGLLFITLPPWANK